MRLPSWLAVGVAALLAAGCGPVRLVATSDIPTPLVVKIPVTVAVSMPKEFSQYVHQEERSGTKWEISLGKAQTEGLTRLLNAMFDRVIDVDGINAGAAQAGQGIRAILEPNVEEYAFVTPRDAGSPFYAVSIKYRLNIYTPQGRLADSWSFTGYGTAPARGMSSDEPLNEATSLALRDAGAKLAVEFKEQAVVRGLISGTAPETPLQLNDTAKPSVSTLPGEPATEAGASPAAAPSKQGTAQPEAAQPEAAQPETAQSETAQPETAQLPSAPAKSESVKSEPSGADQLEPEAGKSEAAQPVVPKPASAQAPESQAPESQAPESQAPESQASEAKSSPATLPASKSPETQAPQVGAEQSQP